MGPSVLLVQVEFEQDAFIHKHYLKLSDRNDIEQVSVRAGCSFTGWLHNVVDIQFRLLSKNLRPGFDDSSYNGESFTIRAGSSDRHVVLYL